MTALKTLSHLDAQGEARMVDVSDKPISSRTAQAQGRVYMKAETLALIAKAALPKGDALTTARLAGIMAAKITPNLIPLCHSLILEHIDITFAREEEIPALNIQAACTLHARTGAEMEALTAVSIAALTIYDMCKAVDKTMTIGDLRLLRKTGGTHGDFISPTD